MEGEYKCKNKEKTQETNGITLIALVVTIIVLLILAGISIQMLTGSNGILENSKQANERNSFYSAQEQVKMVYMAVKTEIMSSLTKDSSYNAREHAGELASIAKRDLNGSEWKITPTEENAQGSTITITYTNSSLTQNGVEEGKPAQNGSIIYTIGLEKEDVSLREDGALLAGNSVKMLDKDGKKIDITNDSESLASVYGKKVSNYTKGGTYRVFFIDFEGKYGAKGTVYLKADSTENIRLNGAQDKTVEVGEGEDPEKINTTTYEPTEKAIDMMKKQNPWWGKKDGTVNQMHERCAAWLCSPTAAAESSNRQWEIYFDGEKADYVIGTPSVEMYVDSYNGVKHKTQGNYILGAEYFENGNAHGYKYTLNGEKSTLQGATDYYTGANSLDKTDYGKMYVNGLWWLASPSAYETNRICLVSGNAVLQYTSDGSTVGVCPLVCLKSSFQVQLAE